MRLHSTAPAAMHGTQCKEDAPEANEGPLYKGSAKSVRWVRRYGTLLELLRDRTRLLWRHSSGRPEECEGRGAHPALVLISDANMARAWQCSDHASHAGSESTPAAWPQHSFRTWTRLCLHCTGHIGMVWWDCMAPRAAFGPQTTDNMVDRGMSSPSSAALSLARTRGVCPLGRFE